MFCDSCNQLSILSANKICVKCKSIVYNNLSVLCDVCSTTNKQCSICLKKIVSAQERNKNRGCGCGKRR